MIKAKRNAITERSRARVAAVQAIYQYLIAPDGINNIYTQFIEKENKYNFNENFFNEILIAVSSSQQQLEDKISPFLDRDIHSLGYVERAILLIAYYEFESKSAPIPVIINEAIILAKKFGAEDSHKFINGVLDKIGKKNFKN